MDRFLTHPNELRADFLTRQSAGHDGPFDRARLPPRGPGGWSRPSRRVRGLAAVLAVALPVLLFGVVNVAWRSNAPLPRPWPRSVEVKIVASPPGAAVAPSKAASR